MSQPLLASATAIAPARQPLRLLFELAKYGAASAAALMLDTGVLLALHRGFGIGYLIAAGGGFCAGLVLVYVLSVRFVFNGRRVMSPRDEFIGFAVTGLVGLAANEALMALFVGTLGLAVAMAKVPTAGVVFLLNFATRRALLFGKGAPDA